VLADVLGIDVSRDDLATYSRHEMGPHRRRLGLWSLEKVDIKAAGLNHFTWMLDVRDRRTGEDLYPLFSERWATFSPAFEPLTRSMYGAFDLFPMPGDEHMAEFLPWLSDPVTTPWTRYAISQRDWDGNVARREEACKEIAEMGAGSVEVNHLRDADSEGALEMIENVAGAGNHYHQAMNRPNEGQIANLPLGAIVETPGVVSGAGIATICTGELPEGVAELCRREIAAVQLCVDAVVQGDRQLALQCLLLSPCITDVQVAKEILNDYLTAYREYLPQFW
jgi:alpha-galactosidase